MTLKQHTVKSYDKELNSISSTLDDELGLAIESIEMVKDLIEKSNSPGDANSVERITTHDYKINHLDNLIEKKVTTMLALRQPMAFDLRYIITSLKVSSSLERVGDQAKSIIKKIAYLDQDSIDKKTRISLLKMLEIAQSMVRDAVNAFINHDLDKANKILKRDDEIDDIYRDLFSLIDHDDFNRNQVKAVINILFIAKSFERLADYATDIAKITHYVVSGEVT